MKIKKIAQRMRDYPYDIDMKLKWPECIEDYDEPPEELKKEQEEKERKQKIRKEKAIEDEQEMARLRELMAKKGGWYKMAQKNKQQELQGYFRIFKNKDFYDIYWKGFGDSVEITQHNIPTNLLDQLYNGILNAAKKESLIAYKETAEGKIQSLENLYA